MSNARARHMMLLLALTMLGLIASPAGASAAPPSGATVECGLDPTSYCQTIDKRAATAAVVPRFQGWDALPVGRPSDPPGFRRLAGYRWTGTSWEAVNQYVPVCGPPCSVSYYATPFADGWTWVWGQSTGWVAVRSNQVFVDLSNRNQAERFMVSLGCVPNDMCYFR